MEEAQLGLLGKAEASFGKGLGWGLSEDGGLFQQAWRPRTWQPWK